MKAPAAGAEREARPPVQAWLGPVALGWLVPGAGHIYLKRWNRGVLLLLAIVGMFVFGLLMRGKMFEPTDGDLFTMVLNYGGFAGNLVMGLVFGFYWQRTKRLWPLVIAHTILDVVAFVGYTMLRGKVSWLP